MAIPVQQTQWLASPGQTGRTGSSLRTRQYQSRGRAGTAASRPL